MLQSYILLKFIKTFEGDTLFPEIDLQKWQVTSSQKELKMKIILMNTEYINYEKLVTS